MRSGWRALPKLTSWTQGKRAQTFNIITWDVNYFWSPHMMKQIAKVTNNVINIISHAHIVFYKCLS